ncbi:MAG: hypothetical protein KDD78_02055 [Caldilineaceae bacterium]|nr:hypothetical protein [Caldilineaceae bacterium]
MTKLMTVLFLLSCLFLAACQGVPPLPATDSAPDQLADLDCPLYTLPYPRPEPDYRGKLARDFSPFQAALDRYTSDQAAALDALVRGKTIPQLQESMEAGDLTAEDLLLYYLDRIQRYDVDKLNSVLELNPDALDIARARDEERTAGAGRGPMHGIPVLLKDNIATGDDLHTAAGAAVMLAWNPDRDAFLVAQLRNAGAVILGKANLSEWANWMGGCMPNGFSVNGGQTQNPYGPFETYGSSSGSAVAVAADLATVSVGSETQGSIIAPAGINSVVGLKTSMGLVSRDYVIPLLPAQDVPGPMGRTVTDVAVLLSAMTGVDANDQETAHAVELAGADFTRFLNAEALAGLQVGLPVWNQEAVDAQLTKFGIDDEATRTQLAEIYAQEYATQLAIADKLIDAGVTVVHFPATELPQGVDIVPALTNGYRVAIDAFLADLGEAAPVGSLAEIVAFNSVDPFNRAPYGQDHLEDSLASDLSEADFTALVAANRTVARARIDELFARYAIDVIVSDMGQLYAPAGYPALSVPSGYEIDGAPQNIVLVGGYLSEPHLLAVGYAYEQATQARVAPDLDAWVAPGD